jgi:hypothetical protein
MKKQINIPEFNTLQEMAEFWDTHDITDFEDQLIEVKEPIFKNLRSRIITVTLDADHYEMLQEIADHEHQDTISLVQGWVVRVIEEKKQSMGTAG